jgi:hypothetical protein
MRHLVLAALMGVALAGCTNGHPATSSGGGLSITPAPVGAVTEAPLPAKPATGRTP